MQCSTSHQTRFRRYHYTKNQIFEQSLDVWESIDEPPEGKDRSGSNTKQLPIVVLVVGSAWLGHRSFVYGPTSWWNSSGPRTFARLGCTCVCIRHRGAFPKTRVVPSILVSLAVISPATFRGGMNTDILLIATLVFFLTWLLLTLAGRGSANFDDMLKDVADALVWVHGNKKTILGITSSESPPLIFGGYSSGGHVAATLLQRPHILASRGLQLLPGKDTNQVCDGIIMVSPVLAVRPVPSLAPPAQLPLDLPRWCTDMVVQAVWGAEAAEILPSPLHGSPLPRLPHLMIGCKHETFGINWLDVFFCFRTFSKLLKSKGIPARVVEVASDHWNILNSRELAKVLEKELHWFSSSFINKTNE